MSYHPRSGRSVARACWRDGRGALRCKRPPGTFAGFGADDTVLELPGSAAKAPGKVTPEDFLIANLNRFKGDGVPTGQSLGTTKLPAGSITDQVAVDALTIVIRRLSAGVAAITADGGVRQLLADARNLLGAGDASGFGALVAYVKSNVVAIGQQVAAYADQLGLPAPKFPVNIAGLSGLKLFAAAGAVGAIALFFMTRRTP